MRSFNKFKHKPNTYSFLYRLWDLFSLIATLFLATQIFGNSFSKDHMFIVLVVAVIYLYIAETLDLYQSWRVGSYKQMLLTVAAALTIAFIGLIILSFAFKYSHHISRLTTGVWYLLALVLCLSMRWFNHNYNITRAKLGINLKRVAIIGATSAGDELHHELTKHAELGFNFIGFFDDRVQERRYRKMIVIDDIDQAIAQARAGDIDILYIALPLVAENRIADIITLLGDTTVDVHIVPDVLVSSLMHARITHVGDIDTLSIFESPYLGAKLWLKRSLDLFVSGCILILISPLLLLIALLIKLTSKGPVLFKQRRYGLRGEEILVWKFRSMMVMENGDSNVRQATKNDSRVTPLGAFLRRTSLDELPQFVNVFCGDMSVVGPRPHAVAHNEAYRKQIRFYMLRHQVKPGITGWAQISGWRGETDTLEKMQKRVEFDLHYIENWTLMFDVKIILLTIVRGFSGSNVY